MLLTKEDQIAFIYFILERRFPDYWQQDIDSREALFFEWEGYIAPLLDYLPKNLTLLKLEEKENELDFSFTATSFLHMKFSTDKDLVIKDDEMHLYITPEAVFNIAQVQKRMAEFILQLLPLFEMNNALAQIEQIDFDEELTKLLNES